MAAEESRAHKRRFQLASTELFLQRWKTNYVKEEPPRIELSPRPPVEGLIFDYCRSLSRPTVRVSTPSFMIETTLELLQVDSGSGPSICRSYARPIVRAPISSAPIGTAFELIQVDSGYHISVPRHIDVGSPQGEEERRKAQAGDGEGRSLDGLSEGNSYLNLTVTHGSAGSTQLKARSDATVGDLKKEVSKWCGVPPEDQRFSMEGLPLPWEIELSCVGEGTTLEVASREKEEETLAYRVHHGSRGYRTFETQAWDTVARLTNDVAVWCNERPDNLRLLWKGTTLPGELALSNVESGTTLQVVTRQ